MFKDFQVKMIKDISGACNFIEKETLAKMFSSEFCNLFKSTFLYRTPLVAASDNTIFTTEPMKQHVKKHFLIRSLCFKESER